MAKQITVIPPTINPHTKQASSVPTKRKVAAYARVSTDSDEQFTSYEAQVEYYTNYIKSNPRWEFVGVYTEMLTLTLKQMHPTCTQTAP